LAFTEQVKKEENRFRQWEAQVKICPLDHAKSSLINLFVLCSSYRNVIDSTRTWKLNMLKSKQWKVNWNKCIKCTIVVP
jgi:hypothetical protein